MFSNELELQKRFIDLKKKNINKNEKLLSEFNARFGNVDIVQVILKNENFMKHDQAYVLSNYHYAKVLSFLHKKAIRTYNYLKNQTDYSDSTLQSIISRLKSTNIIEEVSENRFIISPEFQIPILQFISYEAKLKDWKKALLQATLNKKFSSHSYVILPIENAQKINDKKLKYFKLYNIGLIGVSQNELQYLFKPKKQIVKIKINPSFISSIAKYQIVTKSYSDVAVIK